MVIDPTTSDMVATYPRLIEIMPKTGMIKDINKQPYSSMTLLCYGEIYESLGKKDEALSCYKAVASSENVPEDVLNTANEKIGSANVKDKK